MAGRTDSAFDEACNVVVALFPYHELSVRRMMKINEAFREICIDFSEARAALLLSSRTGDQAMEDQGGDWKEIVDRLHSDLSDALLAYEANLQNMRR